VDLSSLAIQLVRGAVGGNAAGAALKKLSLGTVGNSIVDILGGGAVLMAIVGFVRQKMGGKI
jgi:hypothetical protein